MKLEISVEELQKRTLFIATPMYGGMCNFTYTKGLADLTATLVRYGITFNTHFLANESLIQRARNYMTDEFMRSGMTHMLFIDADVGFEPDTVMQLLTVADPQSDHDIVCAPYPKKCISWEKIKEAVDRGFADENPSQLENFVGDYVFNPVMGQKEFRIDEPVEVMESGTGFMMIQRKALESFADTYPELMYTPDHVRTEHFDGSRKIMRYFDCEVDEATNRYLSEDYWFCQKARKADIKVWLCPWLGLTHMGAYIFGGKLEHMARLGVTPTANKDQLDKWKKRNRKSK